MEPFDILPPNALYDILFALDPKDLLALYISDQHIKKYLDNMDFLDKLYNEYNITAITFTSWIKKYNESLIYNPQMYLYRIESILLLPPEEYLDNDFSYRLKVIDIVRELNKKLTFNNYQFGLAISFMDIYCFNYDPNYQDLLCILLSCIKLTFNILNDFEADNDDYLKSIKKLSTPFKKFTLNEFIQRTHQILTYFNGNIIRPSTILYLPLDDDPIKVDLCVLSYYSHELMIYKPSMIYETINYIITGQYQIYVLEELIPICHHLTNTINTLAISDYLIATVAKKIQPYLKYQCENKTFLYKQQPFIYNQPWHIGEYEEEIKVGEGGYGSIVKIKRKVCGKNYVIKKIENIESSYVEIACLKHLNSPYIINLCGFNILDKSQLFLPYYPNDLHKLLETDKIKISKKYVKQLIMGLDYCHTNDIIHRDIKTQNIIYDEEQDVLKLIDFGIAVPYSSKRYRLDPIMAASLWFRAPEALLESTHYTTKIDIWAIGLVFYMFLNKGRYLFEGSMPREMLYRIFHLLGKPTETTWSGVTSLPGWSMTYPISLSKNKMITTNNYEALVKNCLTLDPTQRPDTKKLLTFIENL